MLLEADAPVGERHHRSPAQAGVQTKQENAASRHNLPGTGLRPAPENKGEPSQIEMLEALSEWIATDIKPRAEGRDKFMAAVAMNALGMLAREVANPVAVLDKALCDDLLAGRVTLATPGLLAQLRKVALVKLTNDVPKYAGLAKAKAVWEG